MSQATPTTHQDLWILNTTSQSWALIWPLNPGVIVAPVVYGTRGVENTTNPLTPDVRSAHGMGIDATGNIW